MTTSIVAHRGDCQFNIENTLSSIRHAINHGVKYIEIDVQLSKDGVLMLFHDRNLTRLASINTPLPELTYAELKKITLTCVKHSQRNDNIANLAEVISLISSHPDVTLFIEVKRINFLYFSYRNVLKTLLSVITPAIKQIVIISFSYRFLRLLQKTSPLPIGFVLPNWQANSQKMKKKLQPHYIFCDTEIIPSSFSLTPALSHTSLWVLYEVASIKQVNLYTQRGFRYFETFTSSKLLAATSALKTTTGLHRE